MDAPASTSSAPAAPSTPSATPSAPASSEAKAPVETKTPAAPVAPEKRKYSLKVDGKAQDLELDDTEILTRLQKAEAADRRMQESAKLRKDFMAAVEAIKADPFKALSDPVFGLDLDKLAEQRLAQKYQVELMTPEQRAQFEQQQEFERLKKEAAQTKAELEKRIQAETDARVFQEIEQGFLKALGEEGLEKSTEALFEMARLADIALQNGVEYTPAQLARQVQATLDGRREALAAKLRGGLKGQKLLDALGDDVVREVLRYSVEKVRGKPAEEAPSQDIDITEEEPKKYPDGDVRKGSKNLKSLRDYRSVWKALKRGE